MTTNNNKIWGSDVLASALRETGAPYLVLNPGGSYRGLHDSVVNYLENKNPQIIMCLHEEFAASIAHGYASVTGEPLAVAVHSNVGLMHASMAVFNAWCARCPLILLSANGPVDANQRRPWIDWVHTSADHGALVRNYTKWDDQPASISAAVEAFRRATIITKTEPKAPVLLNLDTFLQEGELENWPHLKPRDRFSLPRPTQPDRQDMSAVLSLIERSNTPILLSGRRPQTEEAWNNRIKLAENLNAKVVTSIGLGSSFPTDHPLHVDEIGFSFSDRSLPSLKEADLIIGLEWRDLGGTLGTIWPEDTAPPTVINCSMDHQITNGWSMDYYSLAPADIHIATTADTFVDALSFKIPQKNKNFDQKPVAATNTPISDSPLRMANIVACFNELTTKYKACLINRPIRWPANSNRFDHLLSHLGDNGGGGLGAGPGMSVGAALALRDHYPDWLPVSIIGDGDFLMASNALWTAAKYEIPLLMIIANNHTYFADEVLQEKVALQRDRPIENKSIGITIDEPKPDIVAIAKALGFQAMGPLEDHRSLEKSLQQGAKSVSEGNRVLLEVIIEPENIDIFPERSNGQI